MKPILLTLLVLTAAVRAQDAGEGEPDPTRASPRLKAALLTGGSAIPEMQVKGMVLGSKPDAGAVLLDVTGGTRLLARAGTPFLVVVEGEGRRLLIKRMGPDGIEVEAPDQKQSATLPGFGAFGGEASPPSPGALAYIQFCDLPLLDALRLLGGQSGDNYSASAEANKISVNVLLRDVAAQSVVEEICKSHNLWFKKDERSGITRIMTLGEYEKDLAGFREEQTEVFTLKYPNVQEIAEGIADLYGERVEFTPTTEEREEDMMRDLQGRFDRFDVLNERTQSAGALSNNMVGGNVNGFSSNGGYTSGFGSSYGSSRYGGGYGDSADSGYGRSRYGRNRGGDRQMDLDDASFQSLTPGLAERIEQALASTSKQAATDLEALRKKPATIYVTASRRNNMVAVRTADARALEDIRALVKKMDVQTPMVLLEVRIVSIDLGRDFHSAFDYQYSDGGTAASFSRENIPQPLNNGLINSAGLNSSDMTFTLVNENFRARMQLFEQKDRVKTLATPLLLTANNEVSRLFLGEERPLVRGVSSQTIITDNNVATTPNTTTEFRNVGHTLLITPNINADRTVTLRLVQENSNINPDAASIPVVTSNTEGENSVSEVPVDVVATKSLSGTFVAKDGMAIAVGGLIEDVDSVKKGQVPVLGSIPVLGLLFQRREEVNSRREMVIIIRPHLMSAPDDRAHLTPDLVRKLAPEAAERLVEEGYLPELGPLPGAKDAEAPPPAPKAAKKESSSKRPQVPGKTLFR